LLVELLCAGIESQSESKIKTWFIVSRLFDIAASNHDLATAAATDKALEENGPPDTTKIAIDGESVADGQGKEKVP